jgi:hypothetical protein
MSRGRISPKPERPPDPAPDEGVKEVIQELRNALKAPFVRVRAPQGTYVHCWVTSIAFRCPSCDTENLAGLSTRISGVDQITCGECGMPFEVEFR